MSAPANWHHAPEALPIQRTEAEWTRLAWTPPPRAELRPRPRREPDPPMPWRLAFAYWALGFTATLSILNVLVGWIGELG